MAAYANQIVFSAIAALIFVAGIRRLVRKWRALDPFEQDLSDARNSDTATDLYFLVHQGLFLAAFFLCVLFTSLDFMKFFLLLTIFIFVASLVFGGFTLGVCLAMMALLGQRPGLEKLARLGLLVSISALENLNTRSPYLVVILAVLFYLSKLPIFS